MKKSQLFNFRFKLGLGRAGTAVVFAMALMSASLMPAGAQDQGATDSQTSSDSATLDRIQQHYQNTTSFSGKFTEQLTGIGGTKRTKTGQVSYKRPGKMRWEFESPQKETVVSDGHKLYDYQPDLNQVLEIPIERAFKSAAPLSFLLGMGNLRRDFNASVAAPSGADTLLHVVLIPKRGGDRVELGLNPSTYALVTAKVTDALGNITSIQFRDVRTNVQLADSMFHFEVPAGADVVQAPGASPQRL
jgi:outer membrane lipoprotein carrier protein